jgi:hypothetical protein
MLCSIWDWRSRSPAWAPASLLAAERIAAPHTATNANLLKLLVIESSSLAADAASMH